MEWIVAAVAAVLVLVAVAVLAVILLYGREQEKTSQWIVEMWNISHGYMVRPAFYSSMVIGRETIYSYVVGASAVEMDITISRQHCMFYEQYGQLFVWNMSAVNPAVLNGRRIDQPVLLQTGDRLELGNSVFLVTGISSDRV